MSVCYKKVLAKTANSVLNQHSTMRNCDILHLDAKGPNEPLWIPEKAENKEPSELCKLERQSTTFLQTLDKLLRSQDQRLQTGCGIQKLLVDS